MSSAYASSSRREKKGSQNKDHASVVNTMSLLRRLSNPFQLWSSRRGSRLEDLHPKVKDDIFTWHLGSADFQRLDADSLLRAQIVGAGYSYAQKVLRACHKCGIIDAETGRPNTVKIDRNMVKTMPAISLEKQKELVMLLFFWEEEVMRWRLLSAEESEIRERLSEEGLRGGLRVELEEALKIVQAKKRVLPSLRDRSGRVTGIEEQLPSYDEARRSR